MRVRILSMLALCLVNSWAIRGLAQESSDVANIRALELRWADSYQKRQISTVSSLLAEDYVITTEDGSMYSKVGFLSQSAGQWHVELAEMQDLKIRVHGDVAIVTGAYHERGEAAGKPYDYHDRFTDVWMKTGGKWQLIASHYSIPASN